MKNFIRVKEDFKCEMCGEEVKGNGYTDHCPKCLWGKHVDKVIPGDRKSNCGGLMKPKAVIYQGGEYKIFYQCEKCGDEFRVKSAKEDSKEKLIELVRNFE